MQIGAFDSQTGRKIKDDVPIGILEKLLDKHYFKDEKLTFENDRLREGFTHVESVIEHDLQDITEEKLVKVLKVFFDCSIVVVGFIVPCERLQTNYL